LKKRSDPVNVSLACPECENPGRLDLPGPAEWSCPGCGRSLKLHGTDGGLACCAVCGNAELYKKKDFPHWLGLTILAGACAAFLGLNAFYNQWWAWAVLLGSAAFDGLLYLWVGDVVVCYRCGAHHRRVPREPAHPPFDLGVAERYRQERIRRKQLEAERKS
jgi:hypothetical protein